MAYLGGPIAPPAPPGFLPDSPAPELRGDRSLDDLPEWFKQMRLKSAQSRFTVSPDEDKQIRHLAEWQQSLEWQLPRLTS